MDDDSPLLIRVEDAIGPASATMFVESGRDRYFIFELTLSGVALYLLGIYINGFVEGLGIKDLGKKHGQAITRAIQYGLDAFKGTQKPDKEELGKHAQALSLIVIPLREYQSDPQARKSGSAKLLQAFEEAGIPEAEARRISNEIVGAIWQ